MSVVTDGNTSEPFELTKKLGVTIDPELFVLALTHRSFAHEAGGVPHNERLEFLGDSVLSIVTVEHLFREYPDRSEGELSKMRAAVVSQRALAGVARELELGKYVLLGKGESQYGGREKDSILSDTFEALLGAIYLSNGIEVARKFVLKHLTSRIEAASKSGAALDWKTSLQELAAREGLGEIKYQAETTGPDHARIFVATVLIAEKPHGEGSATVRKQAEQAAAQQAYQKLSNA